MSRYKHGNNSARGLLAGLGKRVIIGDGSTGAYLQQLTSGPFYPDELNISRPELVERLHREYASAGADFITTNTFGASRLKLRDMGLEKEFERINQSAMRIARETADRLNVRAAGNIGPCGHLPPPLGRMPFETLMANAAEQARILQKYGADFLLLETMTDIQEYRACLAGVLHVARIPVFASMSFTNGDLALSGTGGASFAVTGAFPGLAAIGVNCVSSFEHLETIVGGLAAFSHLPIVCQPNAGAPRSVNGKPVFTMKADEFAEQMEKMYALGASILGSCCGSAPDFTALLAKRFKGRNVAARTVPDELVLSTATTVHRISKDRLFWIGERINPTGRKKLRAELEAGQFTTLRADARAQAEAGAHALDLNVNLDTPNPALMSRAAANLQSLIRIPLVVDSSNPEMIEAFGRAYAGKTIINSISGERTSLNRLLPLAKTYNLAFIALLIDEDGVSAEAAKRLDIARKIVRAAKRLGIPPRNIIFDPLVLSAGAETDKAPVTLATLTLLKKTFPHNKTIMGVSNISFGMPGREVVNAAYLSMAAAAGVDMAIINPLHDAIRHAALAADFLRSGDRGALNRFTRELADYVPAASVSRGNAQSLKAEPAGTLRSALEQCIIDGDGPGALDAVQPLLESIPPADIISRFVAPAMDEVGRRHQEKKFFLPQLIASADAVKTIMPTVRERLTAGASSADAAKVLFATVEGDVHDIGKNIVVSILESFNYQVVDLGKDVPPAKIIEKAIDNKVDIIGLSALMTTTLPAMIRTVEAIRRTPELNHVKIFTGGAAVSPSAAQNTGAIYAADGMEMIRILKNQPAAGESSF